MARCVVRDHINGLPKFLESEEGMLNTQILFLRVPGSLSLFPNGINGRIRMPSTVVHTLGEWRCHKICRTLSILDKSLTYVYLDKICVEDLVVFLSCFPRSSFLERYLNNRVLTNVHCLPSIVSTFIDVLKQKNIFNKGISRIYCTKTIYKMMKPFILMLEDISGYSCWYLTNMVLTNREQYHVEIDFNIKIRLHLAGYDFYECAACEQNHRDNFFYPKRVYIMPCCGGYARSECLILLLISSFFQKNRGIRVNDMFISSMFPRYRVFPSGSGNYDNVPAPVSCKLCNTVYRQSKPIVSRLYKRYLKLHKRKAKIASISNIMESLQWL